MKSMFRNPPTMVIARILLVGLLLMISTTSQAATITSTATGGNWSTANTWIGGVVPAPTDDAIIAFGATVTINANGSCASIVVADGATLVFNKRTFTVHGTTTVNGTLNHLNAGGTPIFNGDVIINSSGSWINTGNEKVTFGGSLTNNGSFNANTASQIFTGTGKSIGGSNPVVFAGALTINIPGSITNNGTLTVATTLGGTGTLTQGINAILNTGGSPSITNLIATAAGNTVNYTGAAQTGKATTYSNLTLSGSGAKTFETSPTVNGILSLEGTASVVVTTGVVTYGSSATLQYNKPAAYTATSEEWITPFAATGGVVIANVGVITMGAAKVFNTGVPLTINTGATLTPGANLLTLGGNFSREGTLTSGSGGVTIAGTAAQSIDGFTTTGAVTMSKTAGIATLQGNLSAAGLTITGVGGTLNLGAGLTHTFTGNISLTAGTLNGGSSTLNANNASPSAWSGSGAVFDAGTGTVNFGAAGGQSLAATATTFYNLTFSNSGIRTLTTATCIVNNILSMEDTATASAAPTYAANAALRYNTVTARFAGPEWITPFIADGGVTISNTGKITAHGPKVFIAAAPLTVHGGSSLVISP